MMIRVFRPRVHGQPVQFLKAMTLNRIQVQTTVHHMLLVLLREGAIVGPIPTLTKGKGVGTSAHHMVRDGRSTLIPTMTGGIPLSKVFQPVAQDAQNFHPMCLVN